MAKERKPIIADRSLDESAKGRQLRIMLRRGSQEMLMECQCITRFLKSRTSTRHTHGKALMFEEAFKMLLAEKRSALKGAGYTFEDVIRYYEEHPPPWFERKLMWSWMDPNKDVVRLPHERYDAFFATKRKLDVPLSARRRVIPL